VLELQSETKQGRKSIATPRDRPAPRSAASTERDIANDSLLLGQVEIYTSKGKKRIERDLCTLQVKHWNPVELHGLIVREVCCRSHEVPQKRAASMNKTSPGA